VGFLCPLMEFMRGFHDWLMQRPSSLFVFVCGSISMVSLIICSMYLDLVDRMLVFWIWIQLPRLMCLAIADLTACTR